MKFIYADDLVLAIQCEIMKDGELTLENDLKIMNDYYTSWRLRLNPSKTEVSAFHLKNKLANYYKIKRCYVVLQPKS